MVEETTQIATAGAVDRKLLVNIEQVQRVASSLALPTRDELADVAAQKRSFRNVCRCLPSPAAAVVCAEDCEALGESSCRLSALQLVGDGARALQEPSGLSFWSVCF